MTGKTSLIFKVLRNFHLNISLKGEFVLVTYESLRRGSCLELPPRIKIFVIKYGGKPYILSKN